MQVTVLCLNLWQGGNLMDELLAFVREVNPDVLLLQEVYNGADPSWERKFRSMDVFREEFDYPYDAFAAAFLEQTDFGEVPQGNAVFSRFPIEGQEVFFYDVPYGPRWDVPPYEKTPRNLQRVEISVGGTPVQLFNTQGIWGTDGADNERRLAMGACIAERVKAHERVILAGDFNVQEKTETIARIDALLANVLKGRLATTFNLRRKTHPVFATAVVDMLFVSPSIRVVEASCPNVDVTDHLPIVAVLELN